MERNGREEIADDVSPFREGKEEGTSLRADGARIRKRKVDYLVKGRMRQLHASRGQSPSTGEMEGAGGGSDLSLLTRKSRRKMPPYSCL